MSGYRFSIIIPSYNRADEITDLIRSLQEQTFVHNRFEVLIVDDGSTDETEHVVQDFAARVGFRLRFFKRNHEGPGPARNYGMSAAEGEYFLFIDSDCLADARWLEEIDLAINRENPDAFGGPDSVLENFTPLQKAIDYSMTSFLTTGGMRGHSKKRLAKFYPRSFNMGIRREIHAKLGGMGKLRHGQDIEFSRRIVASGAKVIHIPAAVVYHKRRTSLRKFFRQMFNWGVARINLTILDQGNLEPLHFMPAIAAVGYTFLTVLTLLTGLFFEIWLGITGLVFLLCGFIFIDSARRYRSLRVGWLAPVFAVCQIFAYGYGFFYNYVRRKIFRRGEVTGFVRRYYQ
jgi:glycosyltransferase involved in cell wall biosynthesis